MTYGRTWHDGPTIRHHNLIAATQPPITGPIDKGKGRSNTAGKGKGKPKRATASDFGIAEVATRTTTGTQAYTASEMGGNTPVAAMYFASGHGITNDPGNTAVMQHGMGATDGTNQWAIAQQANDGVGTSSHAAQGFTTRCLVGNAIGLSDFEAAHSSFGVGEHTVSYSNGDGAASYGFNVMFADCDVDVGNFTLDGTTGAQGVSSMGFDPDVVIFGCAADTLDGTARNGFGWGMGMLTATEQKAVGWSPRNGSGTQEVRQMLRSNRCFTQLSSVSGSELFNLNGSIVTGGFSVTPSAARTNQIGYIALRWASKSAKLVDFQTPTATGAQAYTGVGFAPELIIGALTGNISRDATPPIGDSANHAGLGFFAFNANVERAIGATAYDDGLTNCLSKYSATALLGPNSTTPQASVASLTSLDSDGFTLNYATADSTARLGFYLAVG